MFAFFLVSVFLCRCVLMAIFASTLFVLSDFSFFGLNTAFAYFEGSLFHLDLDQRGKMDSSLQSNQDAASIHVMLCLTLASRATSAWLSTQGF